MLIDFFLEEPNIAQHLSLEITTEKSVFMYIFAQFTHFSFGFFISVSVFGCIQIFSQCSLYFFSVYNDNTSFFKYFLLVNSFFIRISLIILLNFLLTLLKTLSVLSNVFSFSFQFFFDLYFTFFHYF